MLFSLIGCKNRQVNSVLDSVTSESNNNPTLADSSADSSNVNSQEDNTSSNISGTTNSTDVTKSSDTSNSSDVPNPSDTSASSQSTESIESDDSSASASGTNGNQSLPDSTDSDQSVVVAESENLDDVDERAIILNELDTLLSDVLSSLDELEENPITEDLTDLGGN